MTRIRELLCSYDVQLLFHTHQDDPLQTGYPVSAVAYSALPNSRPSAGPSDGRSVMSIGGFIASDDGFESWGCKFETYAPHTS